MAWRISEPWAANNEKAWDRALELYWTLGKPGNLGHGEEMESLNPDEIKKLGRAIMENRVSQRYECLDHCRLAPASAG